MRNLSSGVLLLFGGCMLVGQLAWSQGTYSQVPRPKMAIDLGVTFAGERSNPVPRLCCFWFKGGGVDVAMPIWKGFGVAATLTADHGGNYVGHFDQNRVSFLLGPRYTFLAWKSRGGAEHERRVQLFGQGLVGVAHGFDTLFTNGEQSANEFAFQAGGGVNLHFTRKFGIRPIDVEFVHTQIGATGFSNQNNFRLGTGVIWHF